MILWESGTPILPRRTNKAMLLFMKLSTVFLLAISLQVSASGYSQKVTLSMKNASLQQIFKEINKQTGYEFFFKDELLNKAGKLDINVKNMSLEQALDICFLKLPITYTVVDQAIVVKEKIVPAQTVASTPPPTIRGRVVDSTGKPLAGASVGVRGTKLAVSTDQNGNFSIEAGTNQTLVVTYVGFKDGQYPVKNGVDFMEIVLIQSQTEMSNIAVIITGYQQLPKERSAGSFSSVTNEAIKNKSISMNVIDRLEGLVPGLSVNYGRGNEKFLIRGLTSVNANKSPLIVVDGVPIYDGSTLTSLVNPEDVESVNVLRDATAASIWGAAAANGVVVITTKRGPQSSTPRKMQVGYSGFVSFRGQPDNAYYNLMNSSQLVNAGRQIFDIAAYPWAVVSTSSSSNSRPVVAPHEQALYDQARGIISSSTAQGRLDSLGQLNNGSQVQGLLYQPAMLSNHNVNFKGGSSIYGYYGSIGYTRDEAHNKSNLNRYQLNLRQDFTISKSVRFDLTTNVAFENSDRLLLNDFPGAANTILPYAMLSDNAGKPLSMAYLQRHDPFRATSETQSRINLDYVPLSEPGYTQNSASKFNARINAGLSIKLFKGLTYEGRAQYQRQASEGYDYYNQNSYRVRNERVFFTQAPIAPATNPTYFLPTTGGHYLTNNNTQYAWTVRNQFVYDHLIAKKHQFTALAGTEIRADFAKGLGTFKRGYDFQTMTYGFIDELFLGATGVTNPVNFLPSRTINVLNVQQHSYTEVERRFLSLYSNGAYTYDKRYVLNASIRMDQSNLFGSDRAAQYKPVWSIGGAWNISNEDFFRSKAINNLRLRATYGIAGNSPVPGSGGPYDIVTAANNAIFAGLGTGYTVFNPRNESLTWESTATTNVGIDFGLWDNRLSGSVDVYNKFTDNLLGFTPIDPTTGFSYAYDNLGSLENKGIEIQLNSINIRSKDFSWKTVFTISRNENKIISLKRFSALTAGNKLSGVQTEGYSAYPLFGYNYIGLNSSGNPMALSSVKDTLRLASQIKVDDPVFAGTTQPLWYGGLTNIVTYQNFSLSFLIVYNLGHQMRSDVNRFYTGRLLNNIPAYFEDRWKQPGDELVTDVPRYIANSATSTSTRNVNFYTQSTSNIVSASYAKIRDFTLSYSVGSSLLNKLSMSDLSVYGQINNIMLWTNNKLGIDPEFYDLQQGIRAERMHAFFTFGLRASFK